MCVKFDCVVYINMKKQSTIDEFFKRKHSSSTQDYENLPEIVLDEDTPMSNVPENRFKKTQPENNEIDLSTLERDLGLRKQIYYYPVSQRDTIMRAYINLGPFQQALSVYPKFGSETHKRRFQASWFMLYHWLEYSKSLDAAFCFPCFLFNKPSGMGHYGQRAFTIDGFQNWKKVGGKRSECTSFHNVAQKSCDDLLNGAQDIRNFVCVPFKELHRGHDEGTDSINKGNFREILKALGDFNTGLEELFRTAPKHALYTSPSIQKEIQNLISTKVRRMIYEEINGGKFCLLVDEARNQSNKEKMSIVLRFVNKDGFIWSVSLGLFMYLTLQHKLLRIQLVVKGMMVQAICEAISSVCKPLFQMIVLMHTIINGCFTRSCCITKVFLLDYLLLSMLLVLPLSVPTNLEMHKLRKFHIRFLLTSKGLNQISTLQRAGDTVTQ
uniref:TTF-type domain-containing protein n=1 Tax=Lactuca sativa TaxID=4236 RepID=A0A9R1WCT4_LACSA|nr:hypothetical protein LSAT_V11C200088500 [Lactuca sativa]